MRNQEFEYDFVKVSPTKCGWFALERKFEYQELVRDRSYDGWRLVTVLTPPTGSYGMATHYELIFERAV